MPFRARLLLALVVLAVIGAGGVPDGGPRRGGIEASVLEPVDGGAVLFAARPRPAASPLAARPAVPFLRLAVTVALPRLRRSPGGGLRMRLDEDGDRWRALLLGAPPRAP